MRLVSWNLHGVSLAGGASIDQQHRAWGHIRDLGADIVLAQEVGLNGIPPWARDEWTILAGEAGVGRKTWKWGSVIAARPGFKLRPHLGAMDDPWLAHLYDLVLLGEIDLPAFGGVVVASVHTVAQPVSKWLKETSGPILSEAEVLAIKRPGCSDEPWVNDLAIAALDRQVAGKRFLISGDWNTARKFDKPKSRAGSVFFERAAARGWVECHRGPEEPSFFGRGVPTYQLDHAFCDSATAATVTSCRVVVDDVVRAVSDHAPLLVEFR